MLRACVVCVVLFSRASRSRLMLHSSVIECPTGVQKIMGSIPWGLKMFSSYSHVSYCTLVSRASRARLMLRSCVVLCAFTKIGSLKPITHVMWQHVFPALDWCLRFLVMQQISLLPFFVRKEMHCFPFETRVPFSYISAVFLYYLFEVLRNSKSRHQA